MIPNELREQVIGLAYCAAEAILEVYDSEFAVQHKDDRSPLTAADLAAHRCIVAGLAGLTPEIPVLSEESADEVPLARRRGWSRLWVVDPLDGTREFISRNGEFTVNIGLVVDGRPIMGVVGAPARGIAWWGALGHGASRREAGEVRQIAARRRPSQGAVAVASRSHRDAATDEWLAGQGITETVSAGSSLKFCLVAEGKADVYPRFGPTMEWDTAAGHAVLRAAGGRIRTTDGTPLTYAKPGFRNPGFIAEGVAEA